MRLHHILSLLGLVETITALGPGHRTSYDLKQERYKAKRAALSKREVNPALLYKAHNISVPIDFFPDNPRYEPHLNGTFNLRYWFDASNYKPGGPIFVLLGGETEGDGRLPFLQKGIIAQVTQATNGLGVILEHRYYGTSFPVPNLSVENLRFLSTEQALAEIDYFARNVKFEGIDADLTAPNTPWVVYGGSYAGAQAAFARVKYPETFWGGISSSGVTVAIYDYWQYFEPIRQFAPPITIKNHQLLIDVVDKILLPANNSAHVSTLKNAFGLGNITDKGDFGGIFTNFISGWQSTNWDPKINSPSFFYYQNNLTTTLNNRATEPLRSTVKDLLSYAGYKAETDTENIILNAINYANITSVSRWARTNLTQDQYYTTLDAKAWQGEGIEEQGWRSWYWQVCTEWGYIQTGNTPPEIKPIVSRTQTLEYSTFFCRAAFNISEPPNLEEVNKYGAFDIEYDRLAIIGGNADPWKEATPLATGAKPRNSTTNKPVLEIAHGVHHWEENGVFANETTSVSPPPQVVYARQFVEDFVAQWVKEFHETKNKHQEL
ncbi:serine carboxypeptidase S28-domain-containing protein [Dendryphion nanum]|uniref:Serine carboxypeptidase S28-domain-containing protein n=1 Tax=Dendryphion nanum TaxID=256645 RepID=A0A9P9D0E9_9PLEO|nr:serine carboxypeptidase S28-domain-containing protein [Dendryphion nanum]